MKSVEIIICDNCDGTGIHKTIWGKEMQCSDCKGTGRLTVTTTAETKPYEQGDVPTYEE